MNNQLTDAYYHSHFEFIIKTIPDAWENYGSLSDWIRPGYYRNAPIKDWLILAHNKLIEEGYGTIESLEVCTEFIADGGFIERCGSKITTGISVVKIKGIGRRAVIDES